MEEKQLLRSLRAKDPLALEEAIHRYSAYVYAAISGRGGGQLSHEDVEELSSDVFLALWQRSDCIRTQSLKSWLGAVARNRTVVFLRLHKLLLPLDELTVSVPDDLWKRLDEAERTALVRSAISQLDPTDREIFFRRYDLCQNAAQIASAMHIPSGTVRSRLSRGRQPLKGYLTRGGIDDGTES